MHPVHSCPYQLQMWNDLRPCEDSTTSQSRDFIIFKPNHMTAQYFGTGQDTLLAFAGDMTVRDFTTQLVLEIVYRVAAPHIAASVRSLHRTTACKSVYEMDQYMVIRGLETSKLWQKPQQWRWQNRQIPIQQPTPSANPSTTDVNFEPKQQQTSPRPLNMKP